VLASIIIVAAVGTSLSLPPFFLFPTSIRGRSRLSLVVACARPGRVRGPGLPVEDP
jgi:hypothetical protein